MMEIDVASFGELFLVLAEEITDEIFFAALFAPPLFSLTQCQLNELTTGRIDEWNAGFASQCSSFNHKEVFDETS